MGIGATGGAADFESEGSRFDPWIPNQLLYKRIPFNNTELIAQRILERIPKYILDLDSTFELFDPDDFLDIDDLRTGLEQLGWIDNLSFIGIVIVPPGASPIHIDTGDYTIGFNFPVLNCKRTHTILYKPNDDVDINSKLGKLKNHIGLYEFEEHEVTEITRFELDGPLLMNVKVPHQIINTNNAVRVSASLRFKNDSLLTSSFIS